MLILDGLPESTKYVEAEQEEEEGNDGKTERESGHLSQKVCLLTRNRDRPLW